jgi:hypothetical protein
MKIAEDMNNLMEELKKFIDNNGHRLMVQSINKTFLAGPDAEIPDLLVKMYEIIMKDGDKFPFPKEEARAKVRVVKMADP